ncbi:hypothetical protein KFS98_003587 [Salmonella enterica]|nr:hypothetical protein [Salmonella enterica]
MKQWLDPIVESCLQECIREGIFSNESVKAFKEKLDAKLTPKEGLTRVVVRANPNWVQHPQKPLTFNAEDFTKINQYCYSELGEGFKLGREFEYFYLDIKDIPELKITAHELAAKLTSQFRALALSTDFSVNLV